MKRRAKSEALPFAGSFPGLLGRGLIEATLPPKGA